MLSVRVKDLEEKAQVDAEALISAQVKCIEFDTVQKKNDDLQAELEKANESMKNLEILLASEREVTKESHQELEKRLTQLVEELTLSQKLRYIADVKSQNTTMNFSNLLRDKEKSEEKNKELSNQIKDLTNLKQRLEEENKELKSQLEIVQQMCETAEAKVQELESGLRGLDKAEAAMSSVLQAKAYAETRASKVESKLISLHKAKESLKTLVNTKNTEIEQLKTEHEGLKGQNTANMNQIRHLEDLLGITNNQVEQKAAEIEIQDKEIIRLRKENNEIRLMEDNLRTDLEKERLSHKQMKTDFENTQKELRKMVKILHNMQENQKNNYVHINNSNNTNNNCQIDRNMELNPPPIDMFSSTTNLLSSLLLDTKTPEKPMAFPSTMSAPAIRDFSYSNRNSRDNNKAHSRSNSNNKEPKDGMKIDDSVEKEHLNAIIQELEDKLTVESANRHEGNLTISSLKAEVEISRQTVNLAHARAERLNAKIIELSNLEVKYENTVMRLGEQNELLLKTENSLKELQERYTIQCSQIKELQEALAESRSVS